jgi:superfamily II DNA or RNA helicase
MTSPEVIKPSFKRPIDAPALRFSEIPRNVRDLRKHIYDTALPRGDLRRGQAEALEETVKFFEQGGRSAYVEQVSGYGKSRFMTEISNGYGGKQTFIVPGETAMVNMIDKLGRKDVGRVDGEHEQFNHQKTVITMQKLQSI